MFERQVLNRLDTLTYDQKEYYEMTQARFQHLDDQIEGVQEQLAELYHYIKWSLLGLIVPKFKRGGELTFYIFLAETVFNTDYKK